MTLDVRLRDVDEDDLPIFFAHQYDPEASTMAAFPARDWDAFMAHWRRILDDDTVTARAIVADGEVAGNIVKFTVLGQPHVGYWLGKAFWGQGIATRALAAFLESVTERPLYARAAKHNLGSIRVLEKCGFTKVGVEAIVAGDQGDAIAEIAFALR